MNYSKLSIGEAAEYLNISIDTLRRWDKNGKLIATKSEGGHRYYVKSDLEMFTQPVFALATGWILNSPKKPRDEFYCPTSGEFKGRLSKLQIGLERLKDIKDYYPLIIAVVGEIGNNSFDHNLGNWIDIPGIFFSFDIDKRQIALADRGQGVFKTLKRVKPEIKDDVEALNTAFTEVISGRFPEARGNGLKFVLEVVLDRDIEMEYYSGGAKVSVGNNDKEMLLQKTDQYYSGCLVLIRF